MRLSEVNIKTFELRDANNMVAGEVRILPSGYSGGKGPKLVELRTWRSTGRWKSEQRVIVDSSVIAQILSECSEEKN